MSESGFIDLRIRPGDRGPGDDSIWPSFSDIMTVVVMIFLMALVVIMVRNSNLHRQLLSSMDINQAISSDNQGLTTELSRLKTNYLSLQKILGDSESANEDLNRQLTEEVSRGLKLEETQRLLLTEVAGLEELKDSLSGENLRLLAEKDQLTEENRALYVDNHQLQEARATLEGRLDELSEERIALLAVREELTKENQSLSEDRTRLQGDNLSLEQRVSLLSDEKSGLLGEQDQLNEEIRSLTLNVFQLQNLRDDLEKRLGQLSDENLVLLDARENLRQNRDLLEKERQKLISEKDTLQISLGQLEIRYRTLEEERELLVQRSESLTVSRDQLQQEKDTLLAEVDRLLSVRRRLQAELSLLIEQKQMLQAQQTALSSENERQLSTIEELSRKELLLSGQLEEITQQLEQVTATSREDVGRLTRQNLTLTEQLDDVSSRLSQLNLKLEDQRRNEMSLQEQLVGLNEEYEQLRSRERTALMKHAIASEEIGRLEKLIEKQEQENKALLAQAEQQGMRYASLQEEFEVLDERYRGLIRAARSDVGKVVVSIYFERIGGTYQYRLTMPDEEEPEILSREELDDRLTMLRDRHGRNLYTRIVIPEDSGLSHSEAWKFTNEIHNRYDYYFQQVEREE